MAVDFADERATAALVQCWPMLPLYVLGQGTARCSQMDRLDGEHALATKNPAACHSLGTHRLGPLSDLQDIVAELLALATRRLKDAGGIFRLIVYFPDAMAASWGNSQ